MMNADYTVKDISEVLGISKQGVVRRLKLEAWPYQNGGNRAMTFKLPDLPGDIQKALAAKDDISPALLPMLSPEAALAAVTRIVPEFSLYKGNAGIVPNSGTAWAEAAGLSSEVVRDPRVGRIVRMIQEARNVPRGWKKRAWIEAVATKNETTFQSVYRYMKVYEKKGLAGLHHTKNTSNQPKAWSPEAVDWWVGLCLKQEHRKLAKNGKIKLYAILTEEALHRGWEIGSYRSALWWLKKRATPQLRALQRGSVRALDNTLPPVLRDYSDLRPFEILVGDQHRFDFWVVDEDTGEVFRPEGYFWQDLRTRCFYGAALDKKYDSYLMGLALRMGLKIFGPFDQIYTDHGRPEESRYIMGIMKDMRNLGLNVAQTIEEGGWEGEKVGSEEINPCVLLPGGHRKAIVRNAKAKMIESTFHNFESVLRTEFLVPGYVKELAGCQEETEVDQKDLAKLAGQGKLLTFREFFLKMLQAMDYYNRQRHHRGVYREWAGRPKPSKTTPMDCLNACVLTGWKPVYLSEEAIDLVFLPRETRTVDRGRITLNGEIYEHDSLMTMPKGNRVEVRFDPLDPEWLLVFDGSRYRCRAETMTYSSMKDRTLSQEKIEQKRRRRKGFILEYRQLTSAIPDFRQYSETPALEKAAALISKEQRTKRKEIEELTRERSPEELAAEVARIEARAALPLPRRRDLPDRPTYFLSELSRYRWCVKFLAACGELSLEDADFVASYEVAMNEDQLEYWKLVKAKGGQ